MIDTIKGFIQLEKWFIDTLLIVRVTRLPYFQEKTMRYSIVIILCFGYFLMNAQHSRLEGIVTDYETGKPLSGIQVKVYKLNTWNVITQGMTDSSGYFSIGGLDHQTYDVQFDKPYRRLTILEVSIERDLVQLSHKLALCMNICCEPPMRKWQKPVLNLNQLTSGQVFSKDDIQKSPIKW